MAEAIVLLLLHALLFFAPVATMMVLVKYLSNTGETK